MRATAICPAFVDTRMAAWTGIPGRGDDRSGGLRRGRAGAAAALARMRGSRSSSSSERGKMFEGRSVCRSELPFATAHLTAVRGLVFNVGERHARAVGRHAIGGIDETALQRICSSVPRCDRRHCTRRPGRRRCTAARHDITGTWRCCGAGGAAPAQDFIITSGKARWRGEHSYRAVRYSPRSQEVRAATP